MKEYTGKTVEEALESASAETGVSIDELIYVVSEEKKGIFSKKATIQVFGIEDAVQYGEEYLKPLLVIISEKKLKVILPYLYSLGVVSTVINSASILSLSIDEIIERKELLDYLGEPMVVGSRFNSVFGLSKKKYLKKLEELNINGQMIR